MPSDSRQHTRIFVSEASYFEDRAAGLVSAHQAAVPHALEQIRAWHPAFADTADGEIAGAPFDLDAARLVYARQHGFDTWDAFVADVQAVAVGRRREPFKEAFDALRGQDWNRLTQVVRDHPDVLRTRGTNGNTLLNLAVSLAAGACELPPGAGQLLDFFLQSGADVNLANDRGWTPLHQAAYSNKADLAARLMDAGAALDLEAHGEGGTPLAVALFWGHRQVADVLAEARVVPRNLRIAAGLGREDLIHECFDAAGGLIESAYAGRGFYRPHSGFPVWRPSADRQEVLDEALVWACKADRVDVLALLVAHGANVNADPYRGTPLLWAAANNRVPAARWLLDNGATIGRGTFGGLSHGQGVTALHLAAQSDHLEMATLLLQHGADTAVEDALYHSTPHGWAGHFGSARVKQLLTV
ncbi:MAG TPA: ankyrin repeat domain-containing protein [Vicinamibacterales bacterium]|nr:ankyrin repeat domain-containing protein [Vicinamibacterales bacterium]